MKEVIEKIALEVDQEIGDFMLSDSTSKNGDVFYKNWQVCFEPNIFMLMWQELRDRKK